MEHSSSSSKDSCRGGISVQAEKLIFEVQSILFITLSGTVLMTQKSMSGDRLCSTKNNSIVVVN